jgi:hypothetical protein
MAKPTRPPRSSTSRSETDSLGPLPAATTEDADPTLREELFESAVGQVTVPPVAKSAKLHYHGSVTTTREEPDMDS